MILENIFLYRITHIENIPHILKNGITHKNSPNRNTQFVNIGDVSLISTRNKKIVRVDNGDTAFTDCPKIALGDYIPFYFGTRMPMLYVIQHGGNFVQNATSPENIVYLVISLYKIFHSDIMFYFTDGHATDNLTTFYDRNKIDDLPAIIDWNALKSKFWAGQENLDIKRKMQAEFLVQGDIPFEYLKGFVCYNKLAKDKLICMGCDADSIKINFEAYY